MKFQDTVFARSRLRFSWSPSFLPVLTKDGGGPLPSGYVEYLKRESLRIGALPFYAPDALVPQQMMYSAMQVLGRLNDAPRSSPLWCFLSAIAQEPVDPSQIPAEAIYQLMNMFNPPQQ